MNPASIKQIKDELKERNPAELLELCLRLGKFKKENKELLTYLLFESHNESDYIATVKSYMNDEFEVINMLDGDALDSIVLKHKPDYIIPEIEAIRTERLYDYEKQGYTVVPSAKATKLPTVPGTFSCSNCTKMSPLKTNKQKKILVC